MIELLENRDLQAPVKLTYPLLYVICNWLRQDAWTIVFNRISNCSYQLFAQRYGPPSPPLPDAPYKPRTTRSQHLTYRAIGASNQVRRPGHAVRQAQRSTRKAGHGPHDRMADTLRVD